MEKIFGKWKTDGPMSEFSKQGQKNVKCQQKDCQEKASQYRAQDLGKVQVKTQLHLKWGLEGGDSVKVALKTGGLLSRYYKE